MAPILKNRKIKAERAGKGEIDRQTHSEGERGHQQEITRAEDVDALSFSFSISSHMWPTTRISSAPSSALNNNSHRCLYSELRVPPYVVQKQSRVIHWAND